MWQAEILAGIEQVSGLMYITSHQHYIIMFCSNGLAVAHDAGIFFIGIENMLRYACPRPATFSLRAAQSEGFLRPHSDFFAIRVSEADGRYKMELFSGGSSKPPITNHVDMTLTSGGGVPNIIPDTVFRVLAHMEQTTLVTGKRLETIITIGSSSEIPLTASVWNSGVAASMSHVPLAIPKGKELLYVLNIQLSKSKFQKLTLLSPNGRYIFGIIPSLGNIDKIAYLRLPSLGQTIILL